VTPRRKLIGQSLAAAAKSGRHPLHTTLFLAFTGVKARSGASKIKYDRYLALSCGKSRSPTRVRYRRGIVQAFRTVAAKNASERQSLRVVCCQLNTAQI
jgi:hypothetical protein